MRFLALRKVACNQYRENSYVVSENEWESVALRKAGVHSPTIIY